MAEDGQRGHLCAYTLTQLHAYISMRKHTHIDTHRDISFIFIYSYICTYTFLCVVCVCEYLWTTEEGIGYYSSEDPGANVNHYGCWELHSGFLQEQQMPLATEPSIQLPPQMVIRLHISSLIVSLSVCSSLKSVS